MMEEDQARKTILVRKITIGKYIIIAYDFFVFLFSSCNPLDGAG